MNLTRATRRGASRLLVAGSIVIALSTLAGPAAAQTGATFKLTETVVNAGGNPRDGHRPESANFRISHDAIGDGVAGGRLTSPSYRAEGGFVVAYGPSAEVLGVRFSNRTTLTWNYDPSGGTYNLYRNTLASLPGDYGTCYQSTLSGPPFADPAAPAQGSGWFYLVTADNRLRQEGTKGHRSDGAERPNGTPCP